MASVPHRNATIFESSAAHRAALLGNGRALLLPDIPGRIVPESVTEEQYRWLLDGPENHQILSLAYLAPSRPVNLLYHA